MELHKTVASPPFVYPLLPVAILTGTYQLNLEFKGQKLLHKYFSNPTTTRQQVRRTEEHSNKGTHLRGQAYLGKAEKALLGKKPDFFSLMLQRRNFSGPLRKIHAGAEILRVRAPGLLVHRLYNIIGGHSSNLIVVAGLGKGIKKDKPVFLRKLLKKKT